MGRRAYMSFQPRFSGLLIYCLMCCGAGAQDTTQVTLQVKAGVPLRVVATDTIRFKKDRVIHGRLVEPLFAFDREVVPQGSEVTGRIRGFTPASRSRRAAAIMSGDFTPLHDPEIIFERLTLKDGREISLQTEVTLGSAKAVRFAPAGNRLGRVAAARQAIHEQIESQRQAVITAVKTPGKLHRVSDALLAKLPYHPQTWPSGTRLNATLLAPLDFGIVSIPTADLSQLGGEPSGDLVAQARLLTDLDSRSAAKGLAVEALLTRPLFSQDRHLLYPEGSRLTGTVVQARPARSWHRNGMLRFNFQNIEPSRTGIVPQQVARRVEGQLEGAEVAKTDKVTIDSEGGAKVNSSKTRFIAPALKLFLAGVGLDRDQAEVNGKPIGAVRSNAGGQALAGVAGFGLIGAALGQISRPVSAGIGYYGAAVSIYTNIIGPGLNLRFAPLTPIEVRFAPRK